MCKNHQLIANILYSTKILLDIINERLKSYSSKEITPEEAGFVKGNSICEQILVLRQIIAKAREFNKLAYIVL